MSIGTPATLGTASGGSGTPTALSLTTTAAVPSADLVGIVGCWGASTARTAAASGAGLTWATDKSQLFTSGYNYNLGCFSAPAPVGIPIGSSLTLTASAGVDGILMAGWHASGLDVSGTRLDVTAGGGAATTAWNTGNGTTTNADDLVIGGSFKDALSTSAPGTGVTELNDFQFAGNAWSLTDAYKIVAATGAQNLQGTWGSAANHVSAFAAYKAAVVGGSDQNLTGAGAIASGEALGSDTVTPGPVTVTPTGIASAEALGTARLDLNVTPTGIASGEALGSDTVTPGAATITPTGIASGEAVGTALVGSGIAAAGAISSGETFGADTVTTGPVELDPAGIASGEAFGQATITGGVLTAGPHQLPTLGVG